MFTKCILKKINISNQSFFFTLLTTVVLSTYLSTESYLILQQTTVMNISIGNDHAGTTYKLELMNYLTSKGYNVINHGTNDDNSMDYPDTVHPVAKDVSNRKSDIGIIICGSGNGANMTANKHENIRSALCWNKEICLLSRQHNDANILSLPARFISLEEAKEMVDIFLSTPFEGGRHQRRIEKINK